MLTRFPFHHNYEIEILTELPSSHGQVKHFYFPDTQEKGGKDGIIVKVFPHQGETWIGTFAFGYHSPNVLSGVFSGPDEHSVYVVSAGQGFIVRADNPEVWQEVRGFPIMDALSITEKSLIVFSDFTSLVAYGKHGIAWMTERLSWDGLKITEVTSDFVRGLAWDAPEEKEVEFFVDINTGSHKGGSNPETID